MRHIIFALFVVLSTLGFAQVPIPTGPTNWMLLEDPLLTTGMSVDASPSITQSGNGTSQYYQRFWNSDSVQPSTPAVAAWIEAGASSSAFANPNDIMQTIRGTFKWRARFYPASNLNTTGFNRVRVKFTFLIQHSISTYAFVGGHHSNPTPTDLVSVSAYSTASVGSASKTSGTLNGPAFDDQVDNKPTSGWTTYDTKEVEVDLFRGQDNVYYNWMNGGLVTLSSDTAQAQALCTPAGEPFGVGGGLGNAIAQLCFGAHSSAFAKWRVVLQGYTYTWHTS